MFSQSLKGQKSRTTLAGGFWLRVSHQAVIKYHSGLQSSEALLGLRICFYVLSHDSWQEACYFPCGPLLGNTKK